jgi:peptidoglycan-associated lipoprotein
MRAANWFALLLVVGLAAGCKPKYPKCEGDKDCKKGEFCVNQTCQQCRADADCGRGKRCASGRCEAIAGWCETSADCPDGQGCKDNRCGPCESDDECGGGKCRAGRCLKPGQCVVDEDCPEGSECQDGACVAPPPEGSATDGPCKLESVFFAFNESVLAQESVDVMARNLECLRSAGNRGIRLEGHCDPRGTEEYNLALGDRRARAASSYLTRAGIAGGRLRPVSKGKLEARGTDDAGWAQDRRVDLFWE